MGLIRMAKTEYAVIEAQPTFENLIFDKPFQIGKGIIKEIVLATIKAKISDEKKIGEGIGQVLYSDIWSSPENTLAENLSLSLKDNPETKHFVMSGKMENFSTGVCREIKGSRFINPMQFYLDIRKTLFEKGKNSGLNGLTSVLAVSPIDLALWDAFGKIKNKSTYSCLDELTMQESLEDRLGMGYKNLQFSDFFRKPNREVRLLYTLAINDLLSELEREIKENGIDAVKIKLQGSVEEDVVRVRDVERVFSSLGIENYVLTLDPNEKYQGTGHLRDFLKKLKAESKKALENVSYIEQPTSRIFDTSIHDMRELADFRIPVIIDEGAYNHETLVEMKNLGWNGIALKPTAKTFSETLLELAIARRNNWHICVQDLTNPSVALVHHLNFIRRTILKNVPAEANARQYCYSSKERLPQEYWGLYEVRNGRIDTRVIRGKGLGY